MQRKEFEYSEKTAELEAVLHELQQPDVSLEDALTLHERGAVLLEELEEFLKHAEVEVRARTAKG